MTNREIFTRFLDHYGLHQVSGDKVEGDITPMLPWLLVDAGWLLVSRNIEQVRFRFDIQKHKMLMRKRYSEMMDYLFSAFGEDETDAVIAKMDEMERVIGNDITIAQMAFMRAIGDGTTTEQRIIMTSAMVSNIFNTLAETALKRSFRLSGKMRQMAMTLHSLVNEIEQFGASYIRLNNIENFYVTEAAERDLDQSVMALEKKIVSWLKGERGE